MDFIEPCFGIGHNLSLICQMTSEDIKHQLIIITAASIVQELCESRGGRPGLSVLTSLLVSVDVKNYWTIHQTTRKSRLHCSFHMSLTVESGLETKWRGGNNSVVRAPDSWLKGCGFESLQERRENFLLHGRLFVLTLISLSVPLPCYITSRSFCQMCRW